MIGFDINAEDLQNKDTNRRIFTVDELIPGKGFASSRVRRKSTEY